MYQMKRNPTHLKELTCEEATTHDLGVMIYCANNTVICMNDSFRWNVTERNVHFTMCDTENNLSIMSCTIYGQADAAIAKTATVLWSAKDNKNSKSPRIEVLISEDGVFDFAAFRPKQLARIFDANPERHFSFMNGIWSSDQSVILATRPYPLNISLSGVQLKDQGTAFVDALEKRQQPSFGSFVTGYPKPPFSSSNITRLFKLDITFNMLEMHRLAQECSLLPFSANANALKYEIQVSLFQPSDFEGLNIITKDIDLEIDQGESNDWDVPLIALFDRMVECGHFERLRFYDASLSGIGRHGINDKRLVEELIEVIKANPKLEYLDLSNMYRCFEWSFYLGHVLEAMEDHQGLHSFTFDELVPFMNDSDNDSDDESYYKGWSDDAYEGLERLISRNRNIKVYDKSGKRCSNGPRIDKLYQRNAFYHGSAGLVKESISTRPLLVATALVESTSEHFQFSALLLSNHADVLCELIQDIDLEGIAAMQQETMLPSSIPPSQAVLSKRKMRIQPPRAAKKVARSTRSKL